MKKGSRPTEEEGGRREGFVSVCPVPMAPNERVFLRSFCFCPRCVLPRTKQCPLALREKSAERCQYYGEKLVGFGSKIPKSVVCGLEVVQ